jgi:hypothetical protein
MARKPPVDLDFNLTQLYQNTQNKSRAFSQPLIEFLPFSEKFEKKSHFQQIQPLVESVRMPYKAEKVVIF